MAQSQQHLPLHLLHSCRDLLAAGTPPHPHYHLNRRRCNQKNKILITPALSPSSIDVRRLMIIILSNSVSGDALFFLELFSEIIDPYHGFPKTSFI